MKIFNRRTQEVQEARIDIDWSVYRMIRDGDRAVMGAGEVAAEFGGGGSMKLYALTSMQGTAMGETALCDGHFHEGRRDMVQLAQEAGDWSGGNWHDVSDNDFVECQMCPPVIPWDL